MNNRTDTEYWQLVWDKFRSGDRHAFNTIYKEFADSLFAYGARITSDKEILKDSVQDLFIDIYKYSSKLRRPDLLEYYLYKTLKRIIFRKMTEDNKFSSIQEIPETTELLLSIDQDAFNEDTEERLNKLRKIVTELDKSDQKLLFLRFNSGLTFLEMGKLLNIKPNTLQKRIYSLLDEVKDRMSKFLVLFLLPVIKHKN